MNTKMYKDAIDVQDACNFTAVVGLLHETAKSILHDDKGGMDAIPSNPAIILIMDKLNDLIHRPDYTAFGPAYDACKLKGEIENEN